MFLATSEACDPPLAQCEVRIVKFTLKLNVQFPPLSGACMIMCGFGMGLPGSGVVDVAFPVIIAHHAALSLNLLTDKVGYCILMVSTVQVKAEPASVSLQRFPITVY